MFVHAFLCALLTVPPLARESSLPDKAKLAAVSGVVSADFASDVGQAKSEAGFGDWTSFAERGALWPSVQWAEVERQLGREGLAHFDAKGQKAAAAAKTSFEEGTAAVPGALLLRGDASSLLFLLGIALTFAALSVTAEAFRFKALDDNLTMPAFSAVVLSAALSYFFAKRRLFGAALDLSRLRELSKGEALLLLLFL